jgi:hypothetical protein
MGTTISGGLSVSDVVNVQVNMSPVAVPLQNFGTLCIAGPSDVIDVVERIRQYATLDQVSSDFSITDPEWLAADLFFSQQPQPAILYIGRFAQTATNAVLHGGIATAAQQLTMLTQLQAVTNGTMQITIDGVSTTVAASAASLTSGLFTTTAQGTLLTTLQAIDNGAFDITIDGTTSNLTGLNFSSPLITTLTEAAAVITTALGTTGSCEWNATTGQFVIRSATTGTASTITYASSPASGTDLSATLQLTAASGASSPVAGTAGLDFSNITNLNGAATIITNALNNGYCWWDGTRFHIQSNSSGPTSTISYASPAGTGTDVSSILQLTAATGALPPVDGITAESALQCAVNLRAFPQWYGLMFAVPTTSPLAVTDHVSVGQFIEGCDPMSIYGYTTQDDTVLDPEVSTDVASVLQAMVLQRTFGQFSSSSPYAVASMFGRAFTVNFQGNNTVITLKFKQEPGVTGEILTESEAATLTAKNCNVFVFYANGAAIIQQGVMAGGFFFDERQGCDWLANQVQVDLFNVLYTSATKIPQTDQGIHILTTTVSNSLVQGVNNGLIARGQWNAAGFGQLNQGDMLTTGYYVFAPSVNTQDQATREQRIAPTIQAAVKLAGAVHFASVIINVNR